MESDVSMFIFDLIITKLAGNRDMHRRMEGLISGTFGLLTFELLGAGQLLSFLRIIQAILMTLLAGSQMSDR